MFIWLQVFLWILGGSAFFAVLFWILTIWAYQQRNAVPERSDTNASRDPWYNPRRKSKEWENLDIAFHGFRGFGFIFSIILFIAVIMNVIGFIPYHPAKYDHYYEVSGTVSYNSYKDGDPIIDGDSGTVYMIRLAGDKTTYIGNDDRLTKYQPGSHVDMKCTLQWNAGIGADQFNCNLAPKGGTWKP